MPCTFYFPSSQRSLREAVLDRQMNSTIPTGLKPDCDVVSSVAFFPFLLTVESKGRTLQLHSKGTSAPPYYSSEEPHWTPRPRAAASPFAWVTNGIVWIRETLQLPSTCTNDYQLFTSAITMSSKHEYLAFICKNYCPRKKKQGHLHCRPRQSHLFLFLGHATCHAGSSPTRDQTYAPCTGSVDS